jgi:hypothetical protein
MKKILTKYGALAVALMVPLAQAQSAGIQLKPAALRLCGQRRSTG